VSLFAELKRRNVVRVGIAYAVIGWFIAQVAEFAFENFGAPDWVLKTFVVVLLLGLPIALLIAWAFEITPDGVKREKDVDRSQSITRTTGRKLDRVIIVALVLALAYFAWERQSGTEQIQSAEQARTANVEHVSPDGPDKRSIAVLPFVNMSSDQEQEWFADGLTEELLNALARTPDLLVAARTSSFKFKGSTEDIPTIAQALRVAHVLEGSVRRGRDRLRVTAQLIRASDGFHLWSQTYDRDPDDVITIQEEVAVEIARALETAMDPEALAGMVSAGTSSVPAYEAYLEALAYWARMTETGDAQLGLNVRSALERSVEADSGFASAHWELAKFWESQMSIASIGSLLTNDTPAERRAKFDLAIGKAIAAEQDPVRQAQFRSLEAWIDLRIGEALRLTNEYLSSRPNDFDAIRGQMSALMYLGRWDDARQIARRLAEVGAEDAGSLQDTVSTLVFANDVPGAVDEARRALVQYPNSTLLKYQAHRALLWHGAVDEARQLVPALLTSQLPMINQQYVLVRQACAEGDAAKASQIIEQLENEYPPELAADLWFIYHLLGQSDNASELLMPLHDADQLYELSRHLVYPYFDVQPFPKLVRVLEQQGIERPPPRAIPFACEGPAA